MTSAFGSGEGSFKSSFYNINLNYIKIIDESKMAIEMYDGIRYRIDEEGLDAVNESIEKLNDHYSKEQEWDKKL